MLADCQLVQREHTVYTKKYAHGFCFAVLCCGYTLTDFPISIRLTSQALWQSNDLPGASKATLMNMDKYFMWIHYERLHNHNKAKHNKTVCIFLGIYCISIQTQQWSLRKIHLEMTAARWRLFIATAICYHKERFGLGINSPFGKVLMQLYVFCSVNVTLYSTLMMILPMPCWGCRVKPQGMAVTSDAFTHIIPFLFIFSIW